jgi:uncharacterized protein (TIGR03067 family)
MTSIFFAATLALVAPQPPASPTGGQPQTGQPQAGQRDGAAKDQSLNGTWTVVSLEKNGQPQPDAKNYTVKAEGNTITCSSQDGKPAMTWKVDFQPNGQIRVTEQDQQGGSPAAQPGKPADTAGRDNANQKSGVYVMTSDFLAVCLHDNNAGGGNAGGNTDRSANSTVKDREQDATRSGASQPTNKSYCSIVLKRQGNANNDNNRDR